MPAAMPKLKEQARGLRLAIAGGGTGGHLFPGIAVAQVFKARHIDNRVLFINAGRPLEVQVLSKLLWPFKTIPIEGIKGRALWRQVSAAGKIPMAMRASMQILKEFHPDLVLGVGGYSAGPVVATAWLLGIASALHEQNQLPGITNRILRRIVDRNFLSFEDTDKRFDPRKTIVTGNPVRDEILILGDQPEGESPGEAFTLLVVGGSQGAHAINEALIGSLEQLKAIKGLQVIHQTGNQDEPWVRKAYAEAGVTATAQAFFDDMAHQYQRADLIVCRAGATTVAEITAMGKAALFVPFPYAADDHQTRNAQALVDANAGEMIAQKDLTPEGLSDKIISHARDRNGLNRIAAKARTLGRPDAALAIIGELYRLLNDPSVARRRYYQRDV